MAEEMRDKGRSEISSEKPMACGQCDYCDVDQGVDVLEGAMNNGMRGLKLFILAWFSSWHFISTKFIKCGCQ